MFWDKIKIDRAKSQAIYLQISEQIIHAIKNGDLQTNDQVPGTRTLGKLLDIHRKTAIAAIKELEEQGWVYSRPNIGTFINTPPENFVSNPSQTYLSEKADFSFKKSYLWDNTELQNKSRWTIDDGQPDFRLIPIEELSRFYSSAIRRKKVVQNIFSQQKVVNPFFIEQFRYYIRQVFRISANENNLTITSNKEQSLFLLGNLLIKNGDIILMSEYMHPLPNMVFKQLGAYVKTIPMDKDGLDTKELEKLCKRGKVKLIYLQTKSQYPTAISLSDDRKQELLTLSQKYNFIIIEDDEAAEFEFKEKKPRSLLEISQQNNVIYLGSFGRYLPSGFRKSLIIAPEDFTIEAQKSSALFGIEDDAMNQALGELIFTEEIFRFHRKAKKIYQARRDKCASLFKEHLSEYVDLTIPESDLAFWIQLHQKVSLIQLKNECLKHQLLIPRNCLYQNKKTTALRWGFGSMDIEEMEESFEIFKYVLELM